mmetsp:Transcript_29431/g.101775  ORF Transcript_29431/g.101775 Transcript_29431/m.101775 type:complete len:310 (+) Transcript_29431:50-979(+)
MSTPSEAPAETSSSDAVSSTVAASSSSDVTSSDAESESEPPPSPSEGGSTKETLSPSVASSSSSLARTSSSGSAPCASAPFAAQAAAASWADLSSACAVLTFTCVDWSRVATSCIFALRSSIFVALDAASCLETAFLHDGVSPKTWHCSILLAFSSCSACCSSIATAAFFAVTSRPSLAAASDAADDAVCGVAAGENARATLRASSSTALLAARFLPITTTLGHGICAGSEARREASRSQCRGAAVGFLALTAARGANMVGASGSSASSLLVASTVRMTRSASDIECADSLISTAWPGCGRVGATPPGL